MKKIFLLIFVLLMTCAPAFAAPRNGNYWQSLNADAKSNYVVGFFDGLFLGKDFARWNQITNGELNESSEAAQESFDVFFADYLSGVTNGEVANKLDAFYGDPKNAPVSLSDAFWIVLQQINGDDPSVIKNVISNFRERGLERLK